MHADRLMRTATRITAACLLAVTFGCAAGRGSVDRDIRAMLERQDEAWNRGDIEAFMEHYLKSDELSFSSGGTTTRGWQATLDGYKRRYPSAERMGHLTFSELEIHPLGSGAALALGRWHLDREPNPVGGNFSLVLRRMGGRWVIVHDHTSRSETPPKDASEPPSP